MYYARIPKVLTEKIATATTQDFFRKCPKDSKHLHGRIGNRDWTKASQNHGNSKEDTQLKAIIIPNHRARDTK